MTSCWAMPCPLDPRCHKEPQEATLQANPFLLRQSGSPTSFAAMMLQMMDTTQAAVAALSSAASNSSNRYETHAITGREMFKILPKSEPFKAGSREAECSAWPAWLWALES